MHNPVMKCWPLNRINVVSVPLLVVLSNLLLRTALPAAARPSEIPLKVSEDRRHLVGQRGAPFLYHADTVWGIQERYAMRTITGNEVVLSTDGTFQQGPMRLALLDLTLGAQPKAYEAKAKKDAAIAEALRRFKHGCRVSNGQL
jgi:hypothetical protein